MVEMELALCYGKTHKLKICKSCRALNWYENGSCKSDCGGKYFNGSSKEVIKYLDADYEFYETEEGMEESEIDHILVEL